MLNFELIEPESHPIITRDYKIPTPAMEELLEKIFVWIRNYYTGCIVYGYQRLGKTISVEFAIDEIRENFDQKIMVGIAPMITNIKISETAFWGQILKAFNHSLWSRGTAQVKRDRLFNYLTIFNENVGGRGRAVLFVDDAQKLEESHFDWLSEIHNDLKLRKFNLMVILVGQPELLARKSTLEDNHKYEIIARFMNEEFQFHGITSEDDIAVILHSYDENTEFPERSGCSYTKYFFPSAFDFGWRLEDEAQKIWREFHNVKISNGIKQEDLIDEIHMEYFARTVENLCIQNKTDDPGFNGFTAEQIQCAIENSGYSGASKYLRYKEILPRPLEEQ